MSEASNVEIPRITGEYAPEAQARRIQVAQAVANVLGDEGSIYD